MNRSDRDGGHLSPPYDCVLLDRDGTINVAPTNSRYVLNPADLALIDGVGPAIRRLNHAGVTVLVVTNQQAIGLGLMAPETLEAIHARLGELLARDGARVDGLYVCPHISGTCDCRKPKPGLLDRALRERGVAANRAVMVGDAQTDMAAAQAAGVPGVMVGSPSAVGPAPEAYPSLGHWVAEVWGE